MLIPIYRITLVPCRPSKSNPFCPTLHNIRFAIILIRQVIFFIIEYTEPTCGTSFANLQNFFNRRLEWQISHLFDIRVEAEKARGWVTYDEKYRSRMAINPYNYWWWEHWLGALACIHDPNLYSKLNDKLTPIANAMVIIIEHLSVKPMSIFISLLEIQHAPCFILRQCSANNSQS